MADSYIGEEDTSKFFKHPVGVLESGVSPEGCICKVLV